MLPDTPAPSLSFAAILTAGEPGIVLSLFRSANELPGRRALEAGFDRMVEFIGVVFDVGVVLEVAVLRGVLGPWAVVRLLAGLVASALNVDALVAVDVRRMGAGAAALDAVVRSVVEGATDILFGFPAIPPRFDSSSVVFSSGEATEDRILSVAIDGVAVDEVGLLAVEASVGLAGGLLRPEVAVLVADDAVGFERRSVRLVGRVVVVDGFATDFLTVPVVPALLVFLVGSSAVTPWLRDDGRSMVVYCVHNTLTL